jgi:membrane-bound lytic murein transglycosylase B
MKKSQSFRGLLFFSLLFSASVSLAQEQSFDEWLEELRAEALGLGISESTLDAALTLVEEPIPRVLELDKSQPEFVQTFAGYMRNRLSDARIERGKSLLVEYKDLFNRIQQQYGVQPHYLVSFWALESNFGDFTGGFSVVNALATLAYDPRRSDFFRNELLTALRIIEEGHIPVEQMSGSWAGAMGQCQFMPSTFYTYARDGDGDGRVDIWNSVPDVFASAANYLSQNGWQSDERWGREVILPDDFDFTLTGTGIRKTVTQWNSLGIRRVNGNALGNADMLGSIVLPAGSQGPAFLVYDNFRTTMVWNRSTFYAISVGHLADRFVGGGPIINMPSVEERPLSRNEVIELQGLLNAQGIDAGTPDGIMGSRTRAAIRTFQEKANIPTDGYANFDLLETIRNF